MANNDSGNGLNLGEIGMIRNILMGEQINDFEQKFKQIQEQISAMEQQLNDKIDQLNTSSQDSFSTMNNETQLKFEDIEKQLLANVEKLNQRIDKVSKTDKARLGKMLEKVSKQLIGE